MGNDTVSQNGLKIIWNHEIWWKIWKFDSRSDPWLIDPLRHGFRAPSKNTLRPKIGFVVEKLLKFNIIGF